MTRYEAGARPPKSDGAPIEFLESQQAARPHKVIAVVQASAGILGGVDKAKAELQGEARRLGGDALLDLEDLGGGRASAKVIVWTER